MGGYTAGQVSGASAFFRYWGSDAIADFNRLHPDRPVVVSDKIAIAAAHQLLQAHGAGNSSDFRLEHFAERLGVSTDDLRELAGLYGTRVDGYRAKHGLDAGREGARPPPARADEVSDDQEEAVEDDLTGRRIREWEVDYDTDQKEAWRETWAAFIEKHFTREQLASATVLCLPSIHAELEVAHYLRLGIRPENIYAVDYATGAGGDHFRETCARLGINCFQGSLESFLKTDYPPPSIVNLDFHGQLSAKSLRSISSLRLAREAIVLTNFMGCREPEGVQDILTEAVLKGTPWYKEFQAAPVPIVPTSSAPPPRSPMAIEFQNQMSDLAERELYERRQAGLAMAVWRHLGRDHWIPEWEPAAARLKDIRDGGDRQNETCLLIEYAKLLDDLMRSVGVRTPGISQHVLTEVMVADPIVRHAERWRYISSSGKGGRPYESTYLRVSFPTRTGLGAWKSRDLAWEFVTTVDRYESNHKHLPERKAQVVSGDAFRLRKPRWQKLSDRVVISVADKDVGSIEVADVRREMERFANNEDQDKLVFEDVTRIVVKNVPDKPRRDHVGPACTDTK